MEPRHGAAGDRHKENRKQHLAVHTETGEGSEVHIRVGDEHANDCRGDHEYQQVGIQVIPGLKQCPDRHDTGNEHIGKDNVMPGGLRQIHRELHTQGHSRHQHEDRNGGVHPFVQPAIPEDHPQKHGFADENHGGGGHGAVGFNGGAIRGIAVEGPRHHIRKGCNHEDAEKPAEEQEQFFSGFADVHLDDGTDAFSLRFHRGVHGGKVLDRTEEYTPDQDPQQDRHPAEYCCLNRSVDGTGPGDGGKLVSEHHIGVGRNVVHAVFLCIGRGWGGFVNAPGSGEPSAVYQVTCAKDHDCDDHQSDSIHE